MTPFSDIPALLLGPFDGRDEGAWAKAPNGVWSPGQVVEHVTNSLELSAQNLRSRVDKPPMERRPRLLKQAIFWWIVSRTGYFGPRRRAPETTLPSAQPDRATTERRLRAAMAAFQALERELLPARASNLFLKHPVFGDLTLPEWMTFHVRHATHHARQVRQRLG